MASNHKTGHIIGRIVLVLLCILFAGLIVVYFMFGRSFLRYRANAKAIAAVSDVQDFRASSTTVCFFSDGTVMSTLKGEKDMYYLKYEEIPKAALDSMIVTEDRKFFSHPGYDVAAIFRAARAYIINEGEVHQGGSTITQQLARNIYLSGEISVERKATEIFLAAALEDKYSKTQILEFYMNNIYFANGYYGIQAAAYGYFGRSANALSLSEIAFLCAIPNNPTLYDPYISMSNTLERRDKVLDQLYSEGFIEKEAYDAALREKITLSKSSREKHDYAETYTYYCATRALMEKSGFKFRFDFVSDEDREEYRKHYYECYTDVQRSLFTGGYRIYTSIDRDKMKELSESIEKELSFETSTNDEGVYKLQASAACIDNSSGLVVAIAGGREQDIPGYTLNRAYQSPRQPGSSVKPLIVYTPFFETGVYPDYKVVDEKFPGGPRNSSRVYSGEIDLRYAVEMSKNTVAWKLFEELTPKVGLSYLKAMHFSSIVEADYVPAASLGGMTYGATAVEMTSAYAALENNGIYRTPTCIERITDSNGHTIVDSAVTSERVYSKNAALKMTDVLYGVMRNGTAKRIDSFGQVTAGKTGTTNDQKDGWFVGYTGYYTTGVWVGYDYPKAMKELMGNTYPAYIWSDFMSVIHEGLPAKDFEMYVDNRPKPAKAPEEELFGEDAEDEASAGGDPEDEHAEDVILGEEDYPGSDMFERSEDADSREETNDGNGDSGEIVWVSPSDTSGSDIVWVEQGAWRDAEQIP